MFLASQGEEEQERERLHLELSRLKPSREVWSCRCAASSLGAWAQPVPAASTSGARGALAPHCAGVRPARTCRQHGAGPSLRSAVGTLGLRP